MQYIKHICTHNRMDQHKTKEVKRIRMGFTSFLIQQSLQEQLGQFVVIDEGYIYLETKHSCRLQLAH